MLHGALPSLLRAWRRRGILCALLVAQPGVSVAYAQDGNDALMQVTAAARTVASEYWRAEACGSQVQVRWIAMRTKMNAISSWISAGSQYEHPELNQDCRIAFNSNQLWTWPKFCAVMVHEYGHLLGHAHQDDPADVMYPFFVRPVANCGPAPISG
jgi:predicted Zn-dependent protease